MTLAFTPSHADRQPVGRLDACRGVVLASLALSLTIAGCNGDSATGTEAVVLTSVSVSPSSGVLEAFGDTLRLQARALDQNGSTIPAQTFTWSSSDERIATVADGLVTAAGSNGTATISAATHGVEGAATVTARLPDGAFLQVTGIPDTTVAGVASDVTVAVLDAGGHVATAYAGTIAFTSTDTAATLPGNYTFRAQDAGVHSFRDAITMTAAGKQTVTATDLADGSITGSQGAFLVVAAEAERLSVRGLAGTVTAGTASDVTVTALDTFGNVATGYLGTVAFTSSDAAAALPSDYTFVAADAGAHSWVDGVTLATEGEQSITVTDVAVASITGSLTGIVVEPASVLFADDFEGGLGPWSVDNGMWEVGAPTSGPNACHSGAQCAATVLAGSYPFSESSLVSPTVTLPSVGANKEIHLRFWHWFSLGTPTGGNPDRAVVAIQERLSPGVWSASTELARYERASGGWTFPLVDLTDYAGKSVRILFDMQGKHSFNSGAGWYIDDVSIGVVQVDGGMPLLEGFENGIGNWSPSNGSWQVGTPTTGPEACYTGTQCAGTVLDGNYPFNRTSLVSPAVHLPEVDTGEEIHLRFRHWFSLGSPTGGSPDRGVVYVQERSAGAWSTSVELARFQLSSGGWTLPRVDLSAYRGTTVRILFELQGSNSFNSGAGWYIDDISIEVVSVDLPLPYMEGFEEGIGAWAASNGIWQIGTPLDGPNGCYGGVQCAGTVLTGNYPFNRSALVSLAFSLPTIGMAEEIQLRFWHWFSLGSATGGSPDRGVVYLEVWTTGAWGPPVELIRFQGSSGGTWTSPLIDLSAYAGSTVRILFDLQGNNAFNTGAGWYIDDVSIQVR